MNAARFLQDLAVVTGVAAAALVAFRRLGLPPVLGYLIAGLIIGPHTPPRLLVADPHSLEALAEVGVVFLLFALGAEFNLTRLARTGVKPLVCAAVEASGMVVVGVVVAGWLGWGGRDGLVLGGATALASTAIVARILLDRAAAPSGWEELAAATLIAEDMIAVLFIALAASPQSLSGGLGGVGELAARFAGVCALVGIIGALLIPRLLAVAERTGMEEVSSLSTVAVCFGVATLTHYFGFSAALGAFLAGAVASLGGRSARLHEIVAPFRDVFGGVFFVSVGMLIDPRWLYENWRVALAAAGALTVLRFGINAAALALVGAGSAAATQASLALLPVGEFSFILAQTAQSSGLTDKPVRALVVAVCLATTMVSSTALPRVDDARLRALIPRGVDDALAAYARVLAGLAPSEAVRRALALLQPSLLQMLLNATLIVGAAFVAAEIGPLVELDRALPGALWLALSAACLPSLSGLARKAQAVALVLLEVAFPPADGLVVLERRPELARLVPAAASASVALAYLAFTSRLLPPGAAWAPVVVAAAAALSWRRLSRAYSVVQSALRDAFADRSSEHAEHALAAFMESPDPARLKVVERRLEPGEWCVGRTLADADLRARTGATVVRRALPSGQSSVPGPGERLGAGDRLSLIGEPEALEAAERLLARGPAPEP